jgi:hypothetical protein
MEFIIELLKAFETSPSPTAKVLFTELDTTPAPVRIPIIKLKLTWVSKLYLEL